jgi:hypothetical protein
MGIALAVSRSIVEAGGGRLGAENDPSGGATFGVALPLSSGNRSNLCWKSVTGQCSNKLVRLAVAGVSKIAGFSGLSFGPLWATLSK